MEITPLHYEESSIIFKETSWLKRNKLESAFIQMNEENCISQPSINVNNIFFTINSRLT